MAPLPASSAAAPRAPAAPLPAAWTRPGVAADQPDEDDLDRGPEPPCPSRPRSALSVLFRAFQWAKDGGPLRAQPRPPASPNDHDDDGFPLLAQEGGEAPGTAAAAAVAAPGARVPDAFAHLAAPKPKPQPAARPPGDRGPRPVRGAYWDELHASDLALSMLPDDRQTFDQELAAEWHTWFRLADERLRELAARRAERGWLAENRRADELPADLCVPGGPLDRCIAAHNHHATIVGDDDAFLDDLCLRPLAGLADDEYQDVRDWCADLLRVHLPARSAGAGAGGGADPSPLLPDDPDARLHHALQRLRAAADNPAGGENEDEDKDADNAASAPGLWGQRPLLTRALALWAAEEARVQRQEASLWAQWSFSLTAAPPEVARAWADPARAPAAPPALPPARALSACDLDDLRARVQLRLQTFHADAMARAVDQRLRRLAHCFLHQFVPELKTHVTLHWLQEDETFAFYSSRAVPRDILEALARCYCARFQVRPLYIETALRNWPVRETEAYRRALRFAAANERNRAQGATGTQNLGLSGAGAAGQPRWARLAMERREADTVDLKDACTHFTQKGTNSSHPPFLPRSSSALRPPAPRPARALEYSDFRAHLERTRAQPLPV